MLLCTGAYYDVVDHNIQVLSLALDIKTVSSTLTMKVSAEFFVSDISKQIVDCVMSSENQMRRVNHVRWQSYYSISIYVSLYRDDKAQE